MSKTQINIIVLVHVLVALFAVVHQCVCDAITCPISGIVAIGFLLGGLGWRWFEQINNSLAAE